jgi:DNA transformation protein and related proteins
MTTREGFLAFILDQLTDIDDITSRPMFGGIGLYAGAVFFGIIFHDILYLKVDDSTRPDYERAGMKPFTPYAPRKTTLQYYEVPAGVLENAEDLAAWARKAITAAAAQ